MKRSLMFVCALLFALGVSVRQPNVSKATGIPTDCSASLSQAELELMADWWMYGEDPDPDWEACSDTISYENAEDLFDLLDQLGWNPTFVPDPSPTPGGALFGGAQKDVEAGPVAGHVSLTKPDDQPGVSAGLDTLSSKSPGLISRVDSLLEFNCSALPCWKQLVEKGDYGVCPAGYNCVANPVCYETTTYCDSDEDMDYVCKYTTTSNVADPDSARIYGNGSDKIKSVLRFVSSLSSDGATDSTCVHVCIANRMRKEMNTVKAKMRFRHDPP